MENYKKITKMGNKEIVFETGKVARQATGAVLVSSGNTQVLSTVVVGKPPGERQDFFPLTVNYLEKTYATGKIPGGFFKREGRPSENETLRSFLSLPRTAVNSSWNILIICWDGLTPSKMFSPITLSYVFSLIVITVNVFIIGCFKCYSGLLLRYNTLYCYMWVSYPF